MRAEDPTEPRVVWRARDVQRVHRFPLVDAGWWSCTRCARSFAVESSWAVDHRLGPAAAIRTFVVCPACAYAVKPTRLRVHVERVEAAGQSSLRELVQYVRRRRGTSDGALVLRAEDTSHLAAAADRPVQEVVDELAARGLAEVT